MLSHYSTSYDIISILQKKKKKSTVNYFFLKIYCKNIGND